MEKGNWSAQFHFEGISMTGDDLIDHVNYYSDFKYIMENIVKKMLRCEKVRKKTTVTLEVLFELDNVDMAMFKKKYLPFLEGEKKESYFAAFMAWLASMKIIYFTTQAKKESEEKK